MGCSTSAVQPVPGRDIADACGIKVRVNPSTPEQPQKHVNGTSKVLPKLKANNKGPLQKNGTRPPPLAFEVPIFEDESSLIKKHPPKKFRRLEEATGEPPELTHEELDERLKEAEKRRREILSQRVMSAKTRPRGQNRDMNHADGLSNDSPDSWGGK